VYFGITDAQLLSDFAKNIRQEGRGSFYGDPFHCQAWVLAAFWQLLDSDSQSFYTELALTIGPELILRAVNISAHRILRSAASPDRVDIGGS
jgi:hypothetical protein